MKKDKLSRRDFLKLALTSIGAFLASCLPRISQKATSTPTFTAIPTKTNTPEPTTTNTPTSMPTETPTPSEIACFHLLAPENGTKFSASGRITFEWQSQNGATAYKLLITLPNGTIEEYQTELTQFGKYLESLPLGGEYQWQVVAVNNGLREICVSEFFLFNKAAFISPSNNGGGNGDGNGDDGNGDGNGDDGNGDPGQELDPGTQWDQ